MPVVDLDLVLDVGNTRTKLALFQGDRLVKHGPMATHDRAALAAFIGDARLQGIGLGSTAAPDTAFVEHLGTWAPTTVLTGSSPSPLLNAYGTQHSLGADRLANAVGAVRRFPGRPVLVFDLGTCLTYDLCLADGTYCGGGISPGLHMRAQAMHAYSARLPLVELPERPTLIGTTTEDSLAAGIHFGMLGELEGYIRRMRNEHDDLVVVLTGGDALRFVRGLESGIFALPLLTLEGYHALLVHHRSLGGALGPAAAHAVDGPGTAG